MAGSYGGAVKLTGESAYTQGIKKMTQVMKEMSSEMKAVTATYGKNDTSLNALKAKQEVLNKTLNTAKALYSDTSKKVADLTSKYNEQQKKHDELEKQYKEEKNTLDNLSKSVDESSKDYQEQVKVVEKLQQELVKSTNAQNQNAIALSKANTEMNNAKASYEKTKQEVDSMNKKVEEAEKPLNQLKEKFKQSGDEAENASKGGFSTFSVALGNVIANVVTKAISAMKDLASQTLQVGMKFDSAMSKVQAISGTTGDELLALRDKAKEMGSTTKFTATESANAFEYMAMAGWKTEDMLNGIEGIMNLAAASGADLATTSDIVTDALTAMGYSAKDAGRLADVMAAASSNANTNVEMMGATFQYAAPIVGALGYSMEDTAVAIGLMANAGIKGEKAGTALRSTLSRLASPPKACAEAMDELGLSITNADGTMKPLSTVIEDLRKKFDGLSESQQAEYAKAIAGQEAMSGLLAVVNSAPSDYEKLQKAVENSNGAAKEMSDIMMNNAEGGMTLLKSKLEGIQIELSEKFAPAIEKGIDMLDGLLNTIQFIIDHSSEFIGVIKAMGAGIAAYVAYTTAVKIMKDGFMSLTIAQKAVTMAQTVMNAVMNANPIGLIIAGITALVVAFMHFWNTSEEFRQFWIDLWEGIKQVAGTVWEAITGFFTSAWEGIQEAWGGLVEFFTNLWNGITAIFSTIADWINTNIFQPIIAFFQPVIDFFKTSWEIISQLAEGCWEIVKKVWEVVSGWFDNNVIKPVVGFFTGLWNGIKEGASAVWNFIKGVWSAVSGWFSEKVIQPVKNFFTGMWDGLKNGAKNAWEGIKNVFGGVANWFKDIFSKAWQKVKDVFSTGGKIFSGIKEGIANAFKNVVNTIIRGINKIIAFPFNKINDMLDRIRNIEFLGIAPFKNLISRFNVPQIPELYRGGVLEKGQVGLLEGNGAEAVVPLEKNTGWIRKVAGEIMSYMPSRLNSNQINGSMPDNTYNNMVDAFKDALKEMKIELDDEVAGKFVEKTVAKAVFS